MSHIEIHILSSASDAELISRAGLPRLDPEPQQCSVCSARVGEVVGTGGAVFWKPCGLVLDSDSLALLCKRCLAPVYRATGLT